MQRKKLPFVAAVPIPTLDRNGRRLPKKRRKKAVDKVMKELDALFGGAKVIPSPATYRTKSGRTLVEEKEPLVISMTTRTLFRKHNRKVEELASHVGDDLDQEAMAVIAFDSGEGGLLFMDEAGLC